MGRMCGDGFCDEPKELSRVGKSGVSWRKGLWRIGNSIDKKVFRRDILSAANKRDITNAAALLYAGGTALEINSSSWGTMI
jgi:hypothetical protein